ncbi:hypothetical protein [Candidatus Magnetominusculus xianensis]|uniref:Secreted protein n=1 Tax=Candidatus Magnetominusculus xianensis TaxID=1748249 RepID=A0ABR5SC73_9BACT|nr:hypothetical protein [Candidatus Magnetominusculus xianensis]KWT79584.1 hypothetical protein ASN18_2738 [Candidatus Magnetominusculus xianensis]MBF0405614.1 hypothetical protein [Nitrospirota bacterium]
MLKTKLFAAFIVIEAAALAALYVSSVSTVHLKEPEMALKGSLVRVMKLTDVAFWTEARYTRHPSQADFFTAFQDFPMSVDHFPAGSIVPPSQIHGAQ